ncbi:MAG: penicillin-binding protein 1C [Candidatus Kapabacteria bacterium]|nr:penicillin-binding protein 1C [Candidatus Kapabacteria bacterium]
MNLILSIISKAKEFINRLAQLIFSQFIIPFLQKLNHFILKSLPKPYINRFISTKIRLLQHFTKKSKPIIAWLSHYYKPINLFLDKYKKIKKLLLIFLYGLLIFLFLDLIFPVNSDIKYSQTLLSSDGQVLASFLSTDGMWRFKSELNEISPKLITTIIFKEDRFFRYHPGFNPYSIVRALISNIITGKRSFGASTITMQLARMLKPKKRSYFNKLIEIFRAVQLELHFSKSDILEMYLNHLPYSGNIEGCKAASVIYFGTLPDKLSLAQATAMAVIPQNPNKYRPGIENDLIKLLRNKLLNKLLLKNIFSSDEIKTASTEPVIASRHEIPRLAPHLAVRLNQSYPFKPVIRTKINYRIQSIASDLTQNHLINQREKGIFNAAAIVIDNNTRNVIAYIGSNDFFDMVHCGQVDGIKAIRSPGSALKPLAFGMGFEFGLITPKSRLFDIPILNSEFSPENFTGTFKGEVAAELSLIKSLNVPAVRLVQMFKYQTFVDRLIKARFKTISKQRNKLGISIILGGCGVTLEELANMYCSFANAGNISNLKYSIYDTESASEQILSPEASFMIAEILAKSPRPDLLYGYQSLQDIPLIAWKTGTSYGRRDAWSIGFNPEYTVAVWSGNFTGAPCVELTGAEVSTPLMFEIFRYINRNNKTWFHKPENVLSRLVDEQTGLLPGEFTKNTVEDYYIPMVSTMEVSNNLVKVFVSLDEQIAYCEKCLPNGNYKPMLYPKIHPDLMSYYEKYSIPYQKIPAHNPNCNHLSEGNAPVISFPLNGQEYLLEKNSQQKILLQCYSQNDVHEVFWFINNKFFAKASANDKLFFAPETAGKYKISCSDNQGRNRDVNIVVKFY